METAAPDARRTAAPALDPRRWRALALLCGAFFMVVLDVAALVGLSVRLRVCTHHRVREDGR